MLKAHIEESVRVTKLLRIGQFVEMCLEISAEGGIVFTEAYFYGQTVPDRSSRVRKCSLAESFGTDTRHKKESLVLRSQRFGGLVEFYETGQIRWSCTRETLKGQTAEFVVDPVFYREPM